VGELGCASRFVGLSGTSALATGISRKNNGNSESPKSSKNIIF